MLTDEQLCEWRDAAVSGRLPSPVRDDRWQVLRAGVVNLWEFRENEYWFANGWAQLTGGNETGKSSLMAMTTLIPWLADVSSNNIDTLGRAGKSFRYYVEPSGNGGDRRPRDASTYQGWLWVEYGRVSPSGPQFFTTMLFTAARSASASLDMKWCTLAGQARVRGGCDLLVDSQVVAPKSIEAPGFTAHKTATEYRASVAERLLNSTTERLESVGRLLRTTRVPKLGEQLHIDFIRTHLNEALPELERSEINQLADGWDQLDEIRDDLDRSAEAVEAVEGYVRRAWRPYVQARLRRVADLAAEARSRFDAVTRREKEASETLSTATAETDRVRREQAEARTLADTSRAAADELRTSARFMDARERVENLGRARDEESRQRAEVERAQRVVDDALRRADAASKLVAEAEARAADTDGRVVRSGDALRSAADVAGVATHAPVDEVLLRRQLAERRDQVTSARKLLRASERAEHDAVLAEERAAQSTDAAASHSRAADEAWAAAEAERATLAASLGLWGRELSQPVDTALWQEQLPGRDDEGSPLRDRVRSEWFDPLRDEAEDERRVALADQRRAHTAIEGIDAELARLASEGVAWPEAPTLWTRRARPHRGAPLWRLVNPRPGLPAHELAAIEAGLAAAGALDAWVSDEGVVADDVVIAPDSPVDRNLAAVLEPAAGEWSGVVERFLSGVSLIYADESLPDAGLAVALDGRWRNSGLSGHARATHGHAEWVGEAAREANRARRVAELTAERDGWLEHSRATEARVRTAEARLVELRAELSASPTDEALRRALSRADSLSGVAERAAASAGRERQAAQRERAAANEANASLLAFVSPLRLPASAIGLDEVSEQLRLADRARERYLAAAREQASVSNALERERADLASHQATRASAEDDLAIRTTAHQDAVARMSALQAMLGADDAELLSELESLEGRTRLAEADSRRLGEQLNELSARLGAAREAVAGAERDRSQATHNRDAKFADFRALVDAGWAGVAGVELPEPESSGVRQVRDQVAVVRDQVTPRGWKASDADEDLVATRYQTLQDQTHATRAMLEAGGRSLFLDLVDGLPRVTALVDAQGSAAPIGEAMGRLQAIHAELSASYDARVQATLDDLLGSTFLEHLRERIGATQTLINRINAVLASHPTKTDKTTMRIKLDPLEAATKHVLEVLDGSAALDPAVQQQVRDFLRARVDEAKRDAQGSGADWREGLASRLDYRTWYQINLQQRRGSGAWGALTTRTYAELSGGARVVLLMMPLVATLAALYNEMPGTPRPLWLDEAFDGLDAANRATVMELFREFDFDVLLAGPGRLVNVAAVPAAAIYQVVRAPAPMPGADLMVELWSGNQLEALDFSLTPTIAHLNPEGQDSLL